MWLICRKSSKVCNCIIGILSVGSLVDWSKSGGSTVDIKVTSANGQPIPCRMKQLKHGVHECTFTPTEPGLYLIDVFINNIQLPGNLMVVYCIDGILQNAHTNAKLGIPVHCVLEAMQFTMPKSGVHLILRSLPEVRTSVIWMF